MNSNCFNNVPSLYFSIVSDDRVKGCTLTKWWEIHAPSCLSWSVGPMSSNLSEKTKIWGQLDILMDCVKMVQYHNLGSLTSNFEYFGYNRPWNSGPNLILSVRTFKKWLLFSVGVFTTIEGGFHWDEHNSMETWSWTIHSKLRRKLNVIYRSIFFLLV